MKSNLPVLFLVAGFWTSGSILAAQAPAGPAQGLPEQSAPAQSAAATATLAPAISDSGAKPEPKNYVVPSGTRLPLILHNAVTTRNAKPGDPIYERGVGGLGELELDASSPIRRKQIFGVG